MDPLQHSHFLFVCVLFSFEWSAKALINVCVLYLLQPANDRFACTLMVYILAELFFCAITLHSSSVYSRCTPLFSLAHCTLLLCILTALFWNAFLLHSSLVHTHGPLLVYILAALCFLHSHCTLLCFHPCCTFPLYILAAHFWCAFSCTFLLYNLLHSSGAHFRCSPFLCILSEGCRTCVSMSILSSKDLWCVYFFFDVYSVGVCREED